MKPIDYLKAAGVGLAVLALTIALSFPMVFVYATFIEPGHPQVFYNEAALWIAPWSSHVFGPLLFFLFNWLAARRRPERNAWAFAAATIVLYAVIDFGVAGAALGGNFGQYLSLTVAASMAAKAAGAFAGAWLGSRRRNLAA